LKEKLLALTGGDEELAAQIAAQADATNRSIEEQGMITRDTEAPDDEDAEEADSEDDLDVEWDDELVDEVAEAVVEHTAFRALQAHIAELETSLTKALTLIGAQDKAIKALERTAKSKLDEAFDRITEVEREDEERLDELVQDKPRRRRVKLSRPSERYRTEEDEAADLEDQAERVLASFTE
jgi:Mg2+ and Co2+ transporter CorA